VVEKPLGPDEGAWASCHGWNGWWNLQLLGFRAKLYFRTRLASDLRSNTAAAFLNPARPSSVLLTSGNPLSHNAQMPRRFPGVDIGTRSSDAQVWDQLLTLLNKYGDEQLETAVQWLDRTTRDFEIRIGSLDQTDPVATMITARMRDWFFYLSPFGKEPLDAFKVALLNEIRVAGGVLRSAPDVDHAFEWLHEEFKIPPGYKTRLSQKDALNPITASPEVLELVHLREAGQSHDQLQVPRQTFKGRARLSAETTALLIGCVVIAIASDIEAIRTAGSVGILDLLTRLAVGLLVAGAAIASISAVRNRMLRRSWERRLANDMGALYEDSLRVLLRGQNAHA
jgi:hypothetical protein